MYVQDAHDTGLKEGRVERIHLLQNLVATPLTPAKDLLTLTLDELNAMASALETQLKAAIH